MNKKKFFKAFLSILLIFVATFSGVLTARFVVSPFDEGEHSGAISPVGKDGKINIMVVGKDEIAYNTDVIMVACLDTKNKKANILSVPRDTRVYAFGGYRKINSVYGHAYVYGYEMEGELISAVSDITGLPIHYYAIINVKAFREIVDELGGVEFNLKRDYNYDDPYQDLHIHLSRGNQILDGRAAEGLVRFRADYARGDIERIEVQQEFISEMIRQKLNLKYISKVDDIYKSITDNVVSNLKVDEIIKYGKAALNCGQIQTYTLPGEASISPYWIKDEAETNNLLSEVFGYDNLN